MKLLDWIDDRTGYRGSLRRLLDAPVPGGARWSYAFGAALGLSLLVQAVTGVFLMTAYAPGATTAWASVAHIDANMRLGWVLRGVHQFGAQVSIVLVATHLALVLLRAGYRRPREVNYWLGLLLGGLTVAFALSGNPLRWDQRGYWGLRVETGIAGTMPVIGRYAQELILGGGEPGNATLTRLYTVHVVVLPLLVTLLLLGHIALARRHGPALSAAATKASSERWFPGQAARNLTVAFVVLLGIVALTVKNHGVGLDAPADPTSDYPARPEWYFLALYELRKPFHGPLEPIATAVLPGLIALYVAALPFLDKKSDRSLVQRLGVLAPVGLVGLGVVALTFLSIRTDAKDTELAKAVAKAEARAEHARKIAEEGVPPEGALAMMRNDPTTRREALFQEHCASCHRMGELAPADGKTTAPDLSDFGSKAWVMRVLDDPDGEHMFGKTAFKEMMPSVTKPPKDPEAAKQFTAMAAADQEVIASFLEAQARGEKGDGMPGEKLVRQRCTSCHRLDGKTDDEESLAPELRGWGSVGWILAQIDDPGSGKTYTAGSMDAKLEGHMPGFKDKLSEKDRKLLAAFVGEMRTAKKR